MEPIIIQPSEETPKLECHLSGKILVSGKSLTEDPIAFYQPILNWISQLPTEKFLFEMHLEYMNTASSKQIFSMLENAKANKTAKEVAVDWYYESNDEDGLDTGKEFESLLDLTFKFIQY